MENRTYSADSLGRADHRHAAPLVGVLGRVDWPELTVDDLSLGRLSTSDLARGVDVRANDFLGSVGGQRIKRAVDLLAALCLLIVGTPLCVLVGLAIKLEDGGPVLFRQRRVSRGGSLFTLRKLRSMRPDAETDGGPQWAAVNDTRVTRVGRWIRALRIDEIPQAWNVLLGEMSFVGPRPERPEFVDTLSAAIPHYNDRHSVRPGLTGWAQVNQPYAGTVAEARRKLEYDLYYLKHSSVWFDLLILARTAKILLFGWGRR